MKSHTKIVSPKRLVELHPDLFSLGSLQRWRTVGSGPPFAILGPRKIAYDLDLIHEWLANRTVSSTAAAREMTAEGR
jgi:hypothetical protein